MAFFQNSFYFRLAVVYRPVMGKYFHLTINCFLCAIRKPITLNVNGTFGIVERIMAENFVQLFSYVILYMEPITKRALFDLYQCKLLALLLLCRCSLKFNCVELSVVATVKANKRETFVKYKWIKMSYVVFERKHTHHT